MSASDIIIVTLGLQQEYLGAPAVAAKGFALTVREVDSNFFNLKQGVIDLDLSKAPLASPTFTGVPTAPTLYRYKYNTTCYNCFCSNRLK